MSDHLQESSSDGHQGMRALFPNPSLERELHRIDENQFHDFSNAWKQFPFFELLILGKRKMLLETSFVGY